MTTILLKFLIKVGFSITLIIIKTSKYFISITSHGKKL